MQVGRCVICDDVAEVTSQKDGYQAVLCRSCGNYKIDDAAFWEVIGGKLLDVSAARDLLAVQRQAECGAPWITIGNAPWLEA